MKISKYILLSTFFISSHSFANVPTQEQVTFTTIMDVISFCSNDKRCTNVIPIIKKNDLNYDVKYESVQIATDPTDGIDDIIGIDPTDGHGD
jgi:hypothetical protein